MSNRRDNDGRNDAKRGEGSNRQNRRSRGGGGGRRGGNRPHDRRDGRRNPLHDSESLSVVTFNVLAPPYHKLPDRVPHSERHHQQHYSSRNNCILSMLTSRSLCADVLCLQELWFTSEFLQGYDGVLHRTHRSCKFRRTAKPDGLVTYVRKSRYLELTRAWKVNFTDVSCQNALLTERPTLIANCHLTYPHNGYHERLRVLQAQTLLRLIQKYLIAQLSPHMSDADRVPVIVCGDFNGVPNDEVYELFTSRGFVSSFAAVNGREAKVTQLTRENDEKAVDYVFSRMYSRSDITGDIELPELPPFDLEEAERQHAEAMAQRASLRESSEKPDAAGHDGASATGDIENDDTSSGNQGEGHPVASTPADNTSFPLRSWDGHRVCSSYLHSICGRSPCPYAHSLPPLPDTSKWQMHVRVKDEDRTRFYRRRNEGQGKASNYVSLSSSSEETPASLPASGPASPSAEETGASDSSKTEDNEVAKANSASSASTSDSGAAEDDSGSSPNLVGDVVEVTPFMSEFSPTISHLYPRYLEDTV